jgi:hypothetical protein
LLVGLYDGIEHLLICTLVYYRKLCIADGRPRYTFPDGSTGGESESSTNYLQFEVKVMYSNFMARGVVCPSEALLTRCVGLVRR